MAMSVRIVATVSLLVLVCLAPVSHGYTGSQVDLPIVILSKAGEAGTDPGAAAAELGAISGTVTDTRGAPIPYANVITVEGAMIGVVTSADGKYQIQKLPPGRYTVWARLMGYIPESAANVLVEGRKTTVVDFKLTEEPVPPGQFRVVMPGYAAALGDPDVRLLERDARRFAVSLYSQIASAHGNLFFSPWSIRTALGMVYAGARGRTQQQMTAALHDSLGPSRIHITASRLDSLLRETGAGASPADLELHIAQGAWVARSLRLESGFTDTLSLRYGASPSQIDFARGDDARASINAWVADRTRARIRDLIPRGALDSMTRLVVCDAIYFWGAWQDSFPSRETADAPFHLTSHDTVSVPFMHYTHIRRYMENHDLQMLEVPYRGGDHTMLVILPKAVGGLAAMERDLDPDSLGGWITRLENAIVQLALPKFEAESGLRLARELSAMGMPDAFGEGADFSGITPERPLFISDVYHKAFVAVSERGTEASAASAVVKTKGGASAPPRTVYFTADHPFLFLIRHRPSGTILFMGRLVDPR